MRPKYLLRDYSGALMLKRALESYRQYKITVGILKEHNEKYNSYQVIKKELGEDINVVILDQETQGPADTVYQLLKQAQVNDEFLVKDCDSFFEHEVTSGNYVCVSKIQNHEVLKRISAKSFVISNDQGIITSIIEKQIVSDTFCVGGYKFESAEQYCKVFESLQMEREVFVSDVIQQFLLDKQVITEKHVTNYIDVGTSDEWFEYNNKPTYFCDIDGTIIKSKDHNAAEVEPLTENVAVLRRELARGCKIIFCTARSGEVRERTRKILDDLGFVDCDLIMDVHHSKRVLINDYATTNPFPTATSINIKRDSDNLSDFMP
jgi:hypothetical protein